MVVDGYLVQDALMDQEGPMMTRRQKGAYAVALFLSLLMISSNVWAQSEASGQDARGQVPLPRGELIEKFGPSATSATVSAASASETSSIDLQQASSAKRTDIPESQQLLKRVPAPPSAASWPQDQQRVSRSQDDITVGSLWDALPLLAVLFLIGAIALVVKRCMPTRRLLTGAGVLDIVARMPLSGKNSLVLVKMGRRLVLLGVSSDQVHALDVVDDSEQVASLLGEAARHQPDAASAIFANAFSEEVHAYAEEPTGSGAATSARGHVKGLLKKVRKLTQASGVT